MLKAVGLGFGVYILQKPEITLSVCIQCAKWP